MKLSELLHRIEEQIPTELALDWDNVGLLVGDKNQEIHTVYLALDATGEVVAHAVDSGADLILTHHPLIFSGMKRVVSGDFIGNRVITMIKNDISYYAMHTNFDVQVMGDLAGTYLGLQNAKVLDVTTAEDESPKGIGCVADLSSETTLFGLAEKTKAAFGISNVKVFGSRDFQVSRVAISPGSGKSEVDEALAAGADVLITGDIDHHTGIDAVARGLAIIDAGHYGIEHIYIAYMEKLLAELAPELAVVCEPKQEPFWIC